LEAVRSRELLAVITETRDALQLRLRVARRVMAPEQRRMLPTYPDLPLAGAISRRA